MQLCLLAEVQEVYLSLAVSFLVFTNGFQVCIGKHLARMGLRLATARFFRAFPNACVSSIEGMSQDDMELRAYFLLTPKGGRCLIQLDLKIGRLFLLCVA